MTPERLHDLRLLVTLERSDNLSLSFLVTSERLDNLNRSFLEKPERLDNLPFFVNGFCTTLHLLLFLPPTRERYHQPVSC